MSDEQKPTFDAAAYWNKRYDIVDIARSGHIDLPVEYNAWLYRRKQDHVAKAVANAGSSLRGIRLLEVAAGSGAWIDFWNWQGVADYLGIDLSERAIESLKQRFPGRHFLQRDLNDPGLAKAVGAGYDCVSAIDVLYHVVDDERFRAAVVDLASVLKPGGLLIIHDQFLHGPARDHGYIKWRSLKEYESALTAAGFEILYRRPTFFFMIQTVDFSGFSARAMDGLWNWILYPTIRRLPNLAGAAGYVADTVICSVLREGPAMEMMVCRKRG
jgi:SAM-dependent methyltransferase